MKSKIVTLIAAVVFLTMLPSASTAKPRKRRSAYNVNTSLNVPFTFGKTHFILGLPTDYSSPTLKLEQQAPDTQASLECPIAVKNGRICQVFFAPDADLQKLLISLIDQEAHSIKVAIFSFTDGEIAKALVRAKNRGVAVQLITDQGCIRDKFSKIAALHEQGLEVLVYCPAAKRSILNDIMHLKLVIFGKNIASRTLLWTGSFNFTKSAKTNNQEMVIVVDDAEVVRACQRQFELLKSRSAANNPLLLAQVQQAQLTRKS